MRELLLLAIILVCPLAMILMMRGRHGQGGDTRSLGRAEVERGASPRARRP